MGPSVRGPRIDTPSAFKWVLQHILDRCRFITAVGHTLSTLWITAIAVLSPRRVIQQLLEGGSISLIRQ